MPHQMIVRHAPLFCHLIAFLHPFLAQLLALAAVLPLDAASHILRNVAGHPDGALRVLVDGDHDDIGGVDPAALALEAFNEGIYADLDRGVAHIGDPPGEYDEIIEVGALFEAEVVDTGCHEVGIAVAPGDESGCLVDPLHQDASEEASGAVQMLVHQKVTGFSVGIRSLDLVIAAYFDMREFIFFHFFSPKR